MAQRKSLKKPPALKKGDTIGIMAPSSRANKKIVPQAVALLEKMGFKVYVHPQTYAVHAQSAGTAQQKIDALHDLYRDPKIKAIFAANGGNQTGEMLAGLDYKLIGRQPKIIIGYSDISALLHAINKETGAVTFHGPMLRKLSSDLSTAQLKQCFNLLGGKAADMPLKGAKVLTPGKAHGPLIGGNLSLICSLMGTPWQPDFNGAILFLEDINEELSRINRMLGQLENAGALGRIAGLVMGDFSGGKESGTPFGRSLEGIVRDRTQGLGIPVIMKAAFGHGKDLYTLPIGIQARLNITARNPAYCGLTVRLSAAKR